MENVKQVRKIIEDRIIEYRRKGDPGAKDFHFTWDHVKWDVAQFDLDPFEVTDGTPSTYLSTSWNNCLNLAQQQQWTDTGSTTDTFSYSFTEGLEIGTEVEAGAELEIASAKVKMSLKMSLSATQTRTTSTTKSRSVQVTVNVPPCTKVEAIAMISIGEFETGFTVTVRAVGPFMYSYRSGGGAGIIVGGVVGQPLMIQDELKKLGGTGNEWTARGTLGAAVGIKSVIETKGVAPDCGPETQCGGTGAAPARRVPVLAAAVMEE